MRKMEKRYTVRSEGGSLDATGSDVKREAVNQAIVLAMMYPGQRILLYLRGRPLKGYSWTQGPRAEVQL